MSCWPPTKQLRLLVLGQQWPTHSEGGQVLDNCGLPQIRDAELSQQAIGRSAFIAEKSTILLGIRRELVSESGHQGYMVIFLGIKYTLAHEDHLTFKTQLFWIPKEFIRYLHKFGFWRCFRFHKLSTICNNLHSNIFFFEHLKGKTLFLTTNP